MREQPVAIDYTSKDYDGFRSSMLEYARRVFPEWNSASEGDFGVLMVELFAYMGDILSYYGDRIAQESYIGTATQRSSLLAISELLGYTPSNGTPATGSVTFQTANPGIARTIPARTQVATDFVEDLDGPVIYETDQDVVVPANGGKVTASVTQGQSKLNVRVGTSTGLPEQAFRLPHKPIVDGSVELYVEDEDDLVAWTPIQFLIDANPNDQVFSTKMDDTGATWVVLGDGVSGRIPSTGLGLFANYRVGGGSVGNVGAGRVQAIVSTSITGVSIERTATGAFNSTAMIGGANPESNSMIRRNAPRAYRTQSRIVTLQDFEDTALSVHSVSRAKAIANHYTSVVMYVTGPGGGTPSAALREDVRQTLADRALAGVSVTVAGPSIVKVNIGKADAKVQIEVVARYSRTAVKRAVTRALQLLFTSSRTSFGMRITLADVLTAIRLVQGVKHVSVPMMARADASQTGTADIQFRDWEIPTLGDITQMTFTGGVA